MTASWEAGRSRPRRWVLVVVVSLAVIVSATVGGLWWLQRQVNPPGGPGEEVAVTVSEGMSVAEIGELLEGEGVISSAGIFRFYTRFNPVGSVQAGDYTLRRNDSMSSVIDLLEAGPEAPEQIRITIPEGLTLAQVAERIDEVDSLSGPRFLELAQDGTVRSRFQPAEVSSLEGFVLPETYFFESEADEETVLRRMVELFDEQATVLGLEAGADRLGLSPYEVVVVASLVEREARVAEERPKIAQVVYNRLERGMLLQIDATVQFALGEQKERLLFSDLEIDSPYNTYRNPGLPPGPIANPGVASLRAALGPEPHDFLYYVLTDEAGNHAFATTLEGHNQNVAESRRKGLL